SVQGQIQLDAGQLALANQQGLIQSTQDIYIAANGVNNAQGQIHSQNLLQLNSQGQLLDNSQGTLSSGNIKIDSGQLNNQQGLIQAQQTIQIDTHNQDLINTNSGQQAGILSQGDIQLSNVKTLNNTGGYLASAKELGIQVNQVLNQQGTILAGKQLNISGIGQNQLLNNQSGQLLSMGGMTLNIDRINNNGKLKPSDANSHIMAVGDLNIITQQLDNQNTLSTDASIQGIDANNLNITSNILNNQTGAIRSSGNQNLNIRQILNNQSGQISSEKQLTIQGDQLEVNNLNGQILSGTGLNLTAKSLSGNGKVLSLGDAQVNLKESYIHSVGAQLQANQNLSLKTQGNITNYGTINSGNRLDLSAVNINNMLDAKIESHETRLNAQNELNNTGLINGDYTRLQANILNNQGTGRIYGTTLAINANTLNNRPNSAGVAPVIASRGDMYLGVQVLNNLANTADYASQSQIFSAGNLYLGGGLDANDKTVGQALVINNESATIESLGNMRLSAKQINNINKNFKTQMVEIERKDNLEKFYQGKWMTFDGTLIKSKHPTEDWSKYTYSQVTSETRVIESAPGQIKAGGALNLDGAQVLNDKSQILAGGVLSNLGGKITSGDLNETKGIREVTAKGKYYWSEVVKKTFGNKRVTKNKPFTNTKTETFDLAVSQALGNQKLNQNQIVTTLVSNNQSGDKTQSSQTQQTHVNGLKDTHNSTEVKKAQNSQGENLTVKQAENVLNSTQSQTGQQNQPSLQSKDLDVSASGTNINVLQAEQANGKNLTTGHAADLSNTIQTQTGQLNQSSQQSKDLNAKLLGENVNLSKAEHVNDQNQQLTETQQMANHSQVNDLQQNSTSLQTKELNVSVAESAQQQGAIAGQAQANNVTQQANAPSKADDSIQYEIRTLQSTEIKVPNSALYRVNANSKAGYLIETDPSFTNYKTWLSSDYMLDALGLDPALKQKRLADGLYEQRLVQDQIANLTGYRFLEGYSNDDEQYKALMNNGVSFAKLYGLRPGIALTAAQTAQLTSDIVWLVEQTVILPNGTKAQALVPQVYVKARVGDLKGDGSLLSGDAIQFKLDGDLINGATIAGRQAVQITADNVQNLNGRIHGNQVAIDTKKDLNNIGGQISAKESMALKVGGNLNIESTTLSTQSKIGGFSSSQTSIDRVAGIYVGSGSQQKLDPSQNTLLIDVAGNTSLKAAQINNSNGTTIINTLGNFDIGAVTTSQTEQLKINSKNGYQYNKKQDIGSQINSEGSLLINAQNISGKAVELNSKQGSIQLSAQNNILLENGLDLSSMSSQFHSKGSFGSKKSSTYDENTTTSIANQLNAGQNIILNSQQGNITATHLQANAGESIQIQALQGNVNLLSTINEKSVSETSSKSNFATYNNRQKGYIDQEVAQTQLVAGKNIDINAGKNIELQANDITAGQSIFVGNTLMQRQADGSLKAADGSLMPENVKLTTLETHDQQWDEQQKGYRGVVKELMKVTEVGLAGVQSLFPGVKVDTKLTVGESNTKREEQIKQTGTNLTANNVYVGSSGQTTLTSAEITAKNAILSGQKVTLNAAEEQNISVTSHSKETIEGLGVKLNKDNVRLGGFVSEDTTQSTKTTETTHKAGSIQTENLKIQGAEGIDLLGQNIKATGDTVLDHGRGELNIGGYENKTTVEDKTKKETISAEVGVRNAYLDAALAVGAVKDAAESVKQAKDQYSQAQRDYASGKITKEALDDTKANVAMATANLANAQIAVGSAAATAAASSATYGFTIGANGERIETTTTTNTTQGKWQGSNLDLNNLTLKSENQDVNVQGSRLTATGTTTFDGTKDFNISAGKEHGQQETSSKTNNQSVSYTYGGGGSVSVGKQTSKSHDESLTNVNSTVDLNTVSGSLNKLNIQGGVVSIADRGDIKVNQIHVESLQDTASGNSSSKGGSVGVGIGLGSGNVTASYNQAKGQNDKAWVNETSKLLIGNAQHDADLDAMGVQKVSNIGGVIANATKNADGSLTDHGKLNYTGALELKDIQDHRSESNRGFNVSTSMGTSIKGESKESSFHPSGSTTVGLQSTGNEKEQLTKATMGQGTVKNTTELTNRDINNTQEITRDQVTGLLNGSVTVDNRLLTESGRAQIIQEQKDLPQNSKIIAGSTATGGLILGSGIVGLLDDKGSVQDATTLTKNNANIAYDAEMAANLQLIQDGISNNIVDNQKLINEYNDQLTKGTSIKNTDVSLVDGLFNENYLKADATTNITNKTDIYLDKDAQKNTVNLVTHEDAHQAGFGEKSANALGWMGEAAFNVNSWVNSSNIDTAKTQIQNIPKVEVAGVNDAQAQLNLLKANTEKYESQIANNDEFDEHLTNKRFADLQKYLEICKSSPNANGCSQADKNKLVAQIKQISADNLSVYKSCKASGQSACMEKNVQQIWAAEQFDDNKLKQLLGSTNVGLASNYDVKAADPQLFKQLEFLQYAQKNCQGMSYGDCGTKYTVSHRSAAENILIPAKSKVLDYIVGEKPRSGASYYLAGIGYVATEILFPESGTDVALMAIGGAASKGAKLASAEAKAGENLASITENQYKHLTCSFRGDMQVKTNNGYTPIQQISVGDWVYSLNETTGKGSYKQVLAQYSNPYKETVYVTVKSKAGQQQTIVSNKIHPYFTVPYNDVPQSSEGHVYHGVVKGGKWVDASNLKAGYKLLVSNNEWYEVVKVDVKSQALQAYNLTVDTNHTYFIKGLNVNLDGVWVHNNCNLDDIQNIKYGKAEIVQKPNGSLEVNYTNAAGTNLKWTPQTEKDIQRSIDSKSKSTESGDIAEAKVAKIVQTSGEKISGFGVQVKNNKNQHIGDADIITEKYFIEVKKSDSAIKKNQVAKYVDENNPNFFNTNGKQVIIYVDEGGLGSEARKLKNQYGDRIKIVSGKSELENILKGK
ncbi:polymorphic toxin-type HINT domain-containing protein, partial [Acinetobacter bereziniae]|uniref:polymorphic toxin-type HINT domain-containing protein n=1 Tax=Acinetobacter bereziniae TaxID=106648 RepID=UPI003D2022AF